MLIVEVDDVDAQPLERRVARLPHVLRRSVHADVRTGRVAHAMGVNFNQVAFEEKFSPPWLMKRVDVLDQMCKKQLAPRFGWNLIVATK